MILMYITFKISIARWQVLKSSERLPTMYNFYLFIYMLIISFYIYVDYIFTAIREKFTPRRNNGRPGVYVY